MEKLDQLLNGLPIELQDDIRLCVREMINEVSTKWYVNIIESERGWGQQIDEVKTFMSFKEANEFVINYNKRNNKPSTPDWYTYATEPYTKNK